MNQKAYSNDWWLSVKESACQCRRCGLNPWVRKILLSRKWQPTSVFLPGKSHGQRILGGCSPWGLRVRHSWASGQQQQMIFINWVNLCFPRFPDSLEKKTTVYFKMANGNLLYDLELKWGLCNNLEGWERVGGGREVQEGGDICIPMASSCWCMVEIKPILSGNYPPVKNK